MEPFYALHAYVCDDCLLVQLPAVERRETIFNDDYAYFSSYSESVLAIPAPMSRRWSTASASTPASRWSRSPATTATCCSTSRRAACRCSASSPRATSPRPPSPPASRAGSRFFGVETAHGARAPRASRADLLLGNNVLAHVPDINDFVAGFTRRCWRRTGVDHHGVPAPAAADRAQLLRHHLPRALSRTSRCSRVEQIFAAPRPDGVRRRGDPAAGRLAAHLRPPRRRRRPHPVGPRVAALRDREIAAGLTALARYRDFAGEVHRTKRDLLRFLMRRPRRPARPWSATARPPRATRC